MSEGEAVTFDTVRQFALALPEVVESTSWGTPSFKVRKKMLARLKEDGQTLAIMIEFGDREFRLATEPDVFYITDHYAGYPMILVRLAQVDRDVLRDLLYGAWRMIAPQSLIAQYPGAVSHEQA